MKRRPRSPSHESERQAIIARYENALRRFQKMQGWQRDTEFADIAEETCRQMLQELYREGQ